MAKYQIKYPSCFGYTCEITDYLYNLLKVKNDDKSDFFVPYFLAPEKPLDDERKRFKEDIRIAVFRCPGYTIGHLIFNREFKILDIVVYDRPMANMFSLSCKELQTALGSFVGTIFNPQTC